MKNYLITAIAFVLVLASGCKSDDYDDGTTPLGNALWIDAAETTPDTRVTFKKTVTELERTLTAVSLSPVGVTTRVEFAVDEAAVETYNLRHGTDYRLLDKDYYDFSALEAVIEAGKNTSEQITIRFKKLDELAIDVTALLPVTIRGNSSDLGLLEGSRTVYYLVRRSSAITTAADLSDCYMWVPSFETAAGQAAINGLSALTYEAIVNIHDFKEGSEISSIMGVEQHCLLRIGDAGFAREQLQVQIGGSKFPDEDRSKLLTPGEWYHIALTWDIAKSEIKIYVNGQLQSAGSLSWDGPTIDLGLVKADAPSARRFMIGYSYNPQRPLNGMISQVRIWSVARTQEEIFRDMYDVDAPETKPELRAYWKFDDEQGNIARDYSMYRNDAYCLDGKNDFETGGRQEGKLKWNNSIEIPMLNRENQ